MISKSPSVSHSQSYTPEQSLPPMHTQSEKLRKILPSPPISPHLDRLYQPEKYYKHERKGSDLKDPVLYADSEMGSTYEEPLFPEHAISTEELIDRHMAMHMTQFKNKLNQPTRDEYRLALSVIPTIGSKFNRNPAAYAKRQREEQENEYWQAKRICARPGTKATPVAIAPAPRVGKRAIKPSTPRPVFPRQKRTPKSSPLERLLEPGKGRSMTPDGKVVAKPDDVDFESLRDFSPPISTLPNNPNLFKTEWASSNLLDLSADPHRYLLHEAEVQLAAKLRLSCAKYICQKRRIFAMRLKELSKGKDFRKTDAQKACRVDVNKASRLHTAYERVGWFDRKFVEEYLDLVQAGEFKDPQLAYVFRPTNTSS